MPANLKRCLLYRPAAIILLLCTTITASAQRKLTVQPRTIVSDISPAMWGIFFEDINFGADGGLYAELVKNRSFEFPSPLTGWKELRQQGGKLLIENAAGSRRIRIQVDGPPAPYGLSNEGFRGMGFHTGATYRFSVQARSEEGGAAGKVELVNTGGKVIAWAELPPFSKEWTTISVTLTAADSAQRGRLNLFISGKGTVLLDEVSLFPTATWRKRAGGLRADLVQLLADMKPGFLRFPGGCIVEGKDLGNRYQWKSTVGPVDKRKL